MKDFFTRAATVAKSLDRGAQNDILRACGVDPLRLRGKVEKARHRGRRIVRGVKELSRAFEKHEDIPLETCVLFIGEEEDNLLGEVVEYDQNDEGEFVWVVRNLDEDDEDLYECTEDLIVAVVPEDELEALIAQMEGSDDDDDDADDDDDDDDDADDDVIDVEWEEA